jgi:hypothetical protein
VLSCPGCEKNLALIGGKLTEAEPATDAVIAKARQERDELAATLHDAASKASEAERSLNTASALRDRDDSKRAERIEKAEGIDNHIRAQIPIVELLGPDGVRATIRNQVIEMVNVKLAGFSDIMQLPPVTLEWAALPGKNTPTISASLGGREMFKLCNSERWIVSAIIQIAIASGDGSTMILLDDAETCVGQYREKLVLLAKDLDIQVVMAMALGHTSITADLEKAGLGQTYWIEDGKVVPLAEARQKVLKAAA